MKYKNGDVIDISNGLNAVVILTVGYPIVKFDCSNYLDKFDIDEVINTLTEARLKLEEIEEDVKNDN